MHLTRFNFKSEIIVWIISLLSLVLTSCQHLPTKEFSQYRLAFNQVQQTSEEILIDFAEAKEAAEKQKEKTQEKRKPQKRAFFNSELDDSSSNQLNAVEVRRRALRTIDKFNNVLVTLAEGKSVESVQSTSAGFVDAAGKFVAVAVGSAVPGLSAITNLIKPLIAQFEKARLREEFTKALKDGVPVISQMIQALYDERKDHITLRYDEANQRQVIIINEITLTTGSIIKLFRQFNAPTNKDPIKNIQETLNQTLKPVENGLQSFPVDLAYGKGKNDSYGQEQVIISHQAISRIKDQVAASQANIEQYQRLKKALETYGMMLEQTQDALNELVSALDKPQEFEEVSEKFFQIAFSVKREIEAFKAARNAAQ